MKRLQDCWNENLVWERIKPLQPQFELRLGDEVLARMSKAMINTKGEAEAQDGQWTMKSEGMWKTRIMVREAQSGTIVATMPWAVPMGKIPARILELTNGTQYPLFLNIGKGGNLESGFTTPTGRFLVSGRSEGMADKHKGIVRIDSAAQTLPELSLLVCLSWYLNMFAVQDAASRGGAMGGALGAAG
ncbi:hypothetical protein EON83_25575 [bacterium]|nr:MAG: hypothetical protein EON83_25575 [bacterium]